MIVKLSLPNGKFIYIKNELWEKYEPKQYFSVGSGTRETTINMNMVVSIEKFEPNPIYAQSIIYNKITTKDIE